MADTISLNRLKRLPYTYTMRKSKYTADVLGPIIAKSRSIAEVLRKLNLTEAGGNYRYIKARINFLKLDTSHFTGKLWSKGRKLGENFYRNAQPLNEVLVKNSCYNYNRLRQRLINAGLKKNVCEICGIDSWLDNKLILELHHINEDHSDNRIKNLQILCPNCHSIQ